MTEMPLTKIIAENFTVFENIAIPFSKGLNVLIGKNGKRGIRWYLDIIAAAKIDISRGADTTARKKYLGILQKINNGKVTLHDNRFYLRPGNQARLEFNLVAEGLRKIALL